MIPLSRNILAVGVGSVIGTFLRYTLNLSGLDTAFPFPTLVENVVGSFLLGLLTGWIAVRNMKDWIRNGLGVGMFGGFTTMSTLASDSYFLIDAPGALFLYLGLSIVGGISFAFIGYRIGEKLGDKKRKKGVVKA